MVQVLQDGFYQGVCELNDQDGSWLPECFVVLSELASLVCEHYEREQAW